MTGWTLFRSWNGANPLLAKFVVLGKNVDRNTFWSLIRGVSGLASGHNALPDHFVTDILQYLHRLKRTLLNLSIISEIETSEVATTRQQTSATDRLFS